MKKIIAIHLMVSLSCSIYAQTNNDVIYNSTILMEADSMPVANGQLITLPQQGLFIADENTLYSLDRERCPEIVKFRLLENFPFEQIIVNDNEFVIKSLQFLMLLGEYETEILSEFDTEDYRIFSGNDSVINIVSTEDSDSSVWYKLDRRTGDVECIMRQAEPIKKIVAGNNIDFCIIGNNVYYINGNDCGELITSEQPILDMILLPEGLMFCTDKILSLIRDEGVYPLAEGDFHGLLHDDNIVYVVLKNGNIWKLENVAPE